MEATLRSSLSSVAERHRLPAGRSGVTGRVTGNAGRRGRRSIPLWMRAESLSDRISSQRANRFAETFAARAVGATQEGCEQRFARRGIRSERTISGAGRIGSRRGGNRTDGTRRAGRSNRRRRRPAPGRAGAGAALRRRWRSRMPQATRPMAREAPGADGGWGPHLCRAEVGDGIDKTSDGGGLHPIDAAATQAESGGGRRPKNPLRVHK